MMSIALHDYGNPMYSDHEQLIPIINHLYLSDETIDGLNDAIENREWLHTEWDQRRQIVGTCSHFRVGNMKQAYNGLCGVILLTDWQTISGQHDLLVKVNIDEDDASRMLLDEYKKLGYDERCVTVKSLNHYLEDALKDERVLQKLLLVFMFACLLLTVMAIAAFSSYYAHLRIHDTAVRKVFGESRMEIFCRTVWGFVLPILISAVFAVPIAYFAVSRWLETFAMRIDNSFMMYASAVVFVLLIVLASIIIQTLRLLRTNPAEALKKE
jgi:putative ABC transport system permease protein